MRIVRIVTAGALVWIATTTLTTRGQLNPYPTNQGQQGGSSSGKNQPPMRQPPLGSTDVPPLSPRVMDEQAKSRNVERQKKLEEDTAKLLSLATELKEQVGKTNQNIMSVDVIKKADEIEKLAKSVKDRMKG